MKKTLLAIACCVALLAGCGKTRYRADMPEQSMMTIVDETNHYTIYMHEETGVLYFCRDYEYGQAVCVLLDTDGKPFMYRK